jgi:hypothetical protein
MVSDVLVKFEPSIEGHHYELAGAPIPRDEVSWSRKNRSYPPFDEACELRDNRVRHAFPSQSACYVDNSRASNFFDGNR